MGYCNHFWSEWQVWKYVGQSFEVRECLWCMKKEKRDIQADEQMGEEREL
jgi:hypothetical protein